MRQSHDSVQQPASHRSNMSVHNDVYTFNSAQLDELKSVHHYFPR